MVKEELREELLKILSDGVVNFEEDNVRDAAQKVIDEGLDAYDAVMNGLAAGMEIVGDLYDQHEYFVPELLMAADSLYAGHDLGRDVPLDKFAEEQMRTDSEIVALSAMMTTTMMGMKKVVQMIKEKNPDVKIMLGGAPLTSDVVNLFGADGYAESAGNAVQEAIKMIAQLRKLQE